MHYVYILYSPNLNRFYIGETHDLDQRLLWHRSQFFLHAYTKIASDWELFLAFKVADISTARKMEAFIKAKKSAKFIRDLKSSPFKKSKLLHRFGMILGVILNIKKH